MIYKCGTPEWDAGPLEVVCSTCYCEPEFIFDDDDYDPAIGPTSGHWYCPNCDDHDCIEIVITKRTGDKP